MSVTPDRKSLARVGVTLLNKEPLELRCDNCGTYWQPARLASGYLPTGWWHCPTDTRHTIDWDTALKPPFSAKRGKGTTDLKTKLP